jgi:pyridoxamine 5'-phosphate oxidase
MKKYFPVDKIDADPIKEFKSWYALAEKQGQVDVDAMILASATKEGKPSARTVLYKGLKDESFLFYTNYESQKGLELIKNPCAALVFYWAMIYRQIRVEGLVHKLTTDESEKYFHSRPRGSQIAAWASHQSQKIKNFEELHKKYTELEQKFDGKEIPLPPYWGGFALEAESIEFWLGQDHRLHHRYLFSKIDSSKWEIEFLSP